MTREQIWLWTLLVLFVPALVLAQQSPPDAINKALADLSGRVNKNLTLSDLQSWRYEQINFPSTALGCPQAGSFYADVVTPGYIFTLVYSGITYDYRVTVDQRFITFCGSTPAVEPIPDCPPTNDPAFLPPRLAIGAQARVSQGGLPNLVRDQPGASGRLLGQIEPGNVFTVLDGPRCSLLDKIVWWQVNFNGLIGWTAEGQDGEYWLEPLGLPGETPLSVDVAAPITAQNATSVGESFRAATPFAISPDGQHYLAISTEGGRYDLALYQFQTRTALKTLQLADTETKVHSLAFDPSGQRVLVGLEDGTVLVVDARSNPNQLEIRALLVEHTSAVNALAFSPDGNLIASGSADNIVRLWDASNGEELATLNQNASVISVQFNRTGSAIISIDEEGGVIVWGLPQTVTVGQAAQPALTPRESG